MDCVFPIKWMAMKLFISSYILDLFDFDFPHSNLMAHLLHGVELQVSKKFEFYFRKNRTNILLLSFCRPIKFTYKRQF